MGSISQDYLNVNTDDSIKASFWVTNDSGYGQKHCMRLDLYRLTKGSYTLYNTTYGDSENSSSSYANLTGKTINNNTTSTINVTVSNLPPGQYGYKATLYAYYNNSWNATTNTNCILDYSTSNRFTITSKFAMSLNYINISDSDDKTINVSFWATNGYSSSKKLCVKFDLYKKSGTSYSLNKTVYGASSTTSSSLTSSTIGQTVAANNTPTIKFDVSSLSTGSYGYKAQLYMYDSATSQWLDMYDSSCYSDKSTQTVFTIAQTVQKWRSSGGYATVALSSDKTYSVTNNTTYLLYGRGFQSTYAGKVIISTNITDQVYSYLVKINSGGDIINIVNEYTGVPNAEFEQIATSDSDGGKIEAIIEKDIWYAYCIRRQDGSETLGSFTITIDIPTAYTITFVHRQVGSTSSLISNTTEKHGEGSTIVFANLNVPNGLSEKYKFSVARGEASLTADTITELTITAKTTVYLYYDLKTYEITFHHHVDGSHMTTTKETLQHGVQITDFTNYMDESLIGYELEEVRDNDSVEITSSITIIGSTTFNLYYKQAYYTVTFHYYRFDKLDGYEQQYLGSHEVNDFEYGETIKLEWYKIPRDDIDIEIDLNKYKYWYVWDDNENDEVYADEYIAITENKVFSFYYEPISYILTVNCTGAKKAYIIVDDDYESIYNTDVIGTVDVQVVPDSKIELRYESYDRTSSNWYAFEGWYKNSALQSNKRIYIFTMPSSDIAIECCATEYSPGTFEWDNPKVQYGEFNLTAVEWNRLWQFIEAIKGGDITHTRAVKGSYLTAAMYKEVAQALDMWTSTISEQVAAGKPITAALINALRTGANNYSDGV